MPSADLVSDLLQRIAALQVRTPTAHYPAGLFPAERYHPHLPYARPDSTLFYTTLVLFKLQALRPHLPAPDRALIDEVEQRAHAAYPLFRHQRGEPTYNFWQLNPQLRHMPNGYLTHRGGHFQLPDDADDSALAHLTLMHSRAEQLFFKAKLARHANGTVRRARHWFPHYDHEPIYSTWFGRRMLINYDACVFSNLLYFVFEHQLPLNTYDRGTIGYLRSVLLRREHLRAPYHVAPYYPRPALILYHVARLLAAHEVPGLSDLRPLVRRDVGLVLKWVSHPLDRMLLTIAQVRLGGSLAHVPAPSAAALRDYWFFQAGLLSAYEGRTAQRLAPRSIFHLRYRCEAYHLAIWLEYEWYQSVG